MKQDQFWAWTVVAGMLLVFSVFMTWISLEWLKRDYDKRNDMRMRSFKSENTYRLLFYVFSIPYVNLVYWMGFGVWYFIKGGYRMWRDFWPWYGRMRRKFAPEK